MVIHFRWVSIQSPRPLKYVKNIFLLKTIILQFNFHWTRKNRMNLTYSRCFFTNCAITDVPYVCSKDSWSCYLIKYASSTRGIQYIVIKWPLREQRPAYEKHWNALITYAPKCNSFVASEQNQHQQKLTGKFSCLILPCNIFVIIQLRLT